METTEQHAGFHKNTAIVCPFSISKTAEKHEKLHAPEEKSGAWSSFGEH